MDEAREPGENEEADGRYLRLPWRALALGLCGLLVALLAVGLYANRYLRPQIGRVATPVAPIVAAAPPSSTPTAVPAAILSPSPTPVPSPSPPPLAVQTPPAATLGPVATAPPALSAATPSASPTLDPAQVAEVSQAYDRYWEVRSQALLNLDKTHLAEVMAGQHLDSIARRIDELRGENRAIQTVVDHQSSVANVLGNHAQVFDDYISNSIYVDFPTKQPLTQPTADELQVFYTSDRVDGTWKVIDSVQAG